MRRRLRDVLHDLDGAVIEEVTHLFGDFFPRPGRVLSEKKPNDCQEQQNQRSEREHGVVGQSSSKLGRFILEPFRKSLFQQTE